MRFIFLLSLLLDLGCGEEIAPPTTPPVAEWCDVDRPREDCDAGGIYISNGNLEEAKALCETPCTHAKGSIICGPTATSDWMNVRFNELSIN